MNECANFCDGFCVTSGDQTQSTGSHHATAASKSSKFDPRRPPYNINNRCSTQPLSTRTLPVEATYYGGIVEYNAHNLYGNDIGPIAFLSIFDSLIHVMRLLFLLQVCLKPWQHTDLSSLFVPMNVHLY